MLQQTAIMQDEEKITELVEPGSQAFLSLLREGKGDQRRCWLATEKHERRYRVEHGIPVLLRPEAEVAAGNDAVARSERYAEAYEEMEYYNAIGAAEAASIHDAMGYSMIRPILEYLPSGTAAFPEPRDLWLDATYDCAAQWDAYRYLAPVTGKTLLQLGGTGIHVVKMLLAGAEQGWLATPMIGEALSALALAEAAGVIDRFACVVAIAEELPFRSELFDAVYGGGTVHHMNTNEALPECARVLKTGGRFAAVDPWRAPLYRIGTKILGKREPGVQCRPLDAARMKNFSATFRYAKLVRHGTLTRYPMLALWKAGLPVSVRTARRIFTCDDALCSLFPGLRRFGSSVASLAEK